MFCNTRGVIVIALANSCMGCQAQNNIKKYTFLMHTGHNGNIQIKSQLHFSPQILSSTDIQHVQSYFLQWKKALYILFKSTVEFVD
jgi:hypothetical protein